MLKRTSGIELPKNHPLYHETEVKLNRYIEDWDGEGKQIQFYEDMGDHILIPRFFPIKDEINDMSNEGDDIVIESKVIPRGERQRKVLPSVTERLRIVISGTTSMLIV